MSGVQIPPSLPLISPARSMTWRVFLCPKSLSACSAVRCGASGGVTAGNDPALAAPCDRDGAQWWLAVPAVSGLVAMAPLVRTLSAHHTKHHAETGVRTPSIAAADASVGPWTPHAARRAGTGPRPPASLRTRSDTAIAVDPYAAAKAIRAQVAASSPAGTAGLRRKRSRSRRPHVAQIPSAARRHRSEARRFPPRRS